MVSVLGQLRAGGVSRWAAVGYEVAVEGAGQVIAFYAELIAAEEAVAEPDEDAIGRLRAEQEAWAVRRRGVRPQDDEEIAAIRSDAEDLLAEPEAEDAPDAPPTEDLHLPDAPEG